MQDYQRQEYVARERVLHPEVFGVTKEQSQLMERVNNAPMYVNKTPQVIVKSSSQIKGSVDTLARTELKIFMREQGMRNIQTYKLKLYSTMTLNGILVRTKDSEATLKTVDSIVCGRFRPMSTSSDSSDSDDDLENTDELYFGQVQYIVQLDEVILCNVDWFKSHRDEITQDQRNGLSVVRVTIGRNRANLMNNWINAEHLSFQQHVLIGEVKNGEEAYVFARI